MRKCFFCVSSAIFLCMLLLHPAWTQETRTPKLVLQETLFDAGAIDEGTVIKHTFRVYNRGNAPLKIKNVRPG